MFGSFQRNLEPFRIRWGMGKGTTGRTLRASASLLRRSHGGPVLLALVLWVLPAVLLMAMSVSQLQRGAAANANAALGLSGTAQTSWAGMGLSVLDILRSLVLTPLMLYAMARVLLGELSRRRPSPIQAVRECAYDWRRALWVAVLCMIGMRLLNYLPTLVYYLLSMLIAFLTAFFSWVPGLVAVLEGIATVLMVLLQSLFSFFSLSATFCIWMVVDQRELRGMAAVLEGIHMLRERIGILVRLYLACFLLYLLGAQGVWLVYGWLGGAVHWLVPSVVSPLLEAVALLLMCAGSAQVCYGDGDGGGSTVHANIPPKDLSKMKSANIKDG